MKNSEKYKTAHTRERAFKEFCNKNKCWENCPVAQKIHKFKQKKVRCSYVWLDLEAEEKRKNAK